MLDYRKLKIGDKVVYKGRDFEGRFNERGVITEVCDDHAIMTDYQSLNSNGTIDPIHYWIDDDNAESFFTDEKREKEIKVGDYVRTPRFLTVKIADVYESEREAIMHDYKETTHYEFEHDDGWNILGKSVRWNEMVFCACKI